MKTTFKPNKDLQDAIEHCIDQLKMYNSSWVKPVSVKNNEWFIRPVIQFGTGKRIIEVHDKYGVLGGSTYVRTHYSYPKMIIEVSDELLNSLYELAAEVYYRLHNISK